MEWKEDTVSWDLKTSRYMRHIVFDNIKLVVCYHRLYENSVIVDEIQTPDGTNIISLVRDRLIERLEKIIERIQNEI
jgi:hypothetical protein